MVLTVVLEAGQGFGMMNVARDAVHGSPDALLPSPAAIDCIQEEPADFAAAVVVMQCGEGSTMQTRALRVVEVHACQRLPTWHCACFHCVPSRRQPASDHCPKPATGLVRYPPSVLDGDAAQAPLLRSRAERARVVGCVGACPK